MCATAALDVLEVEDEVPRRVRLRHGLASPTDVILSRSQAERLAACSTLGDALEVLLSSPGIERRFAEACRKTLTGPSIVELLAPSGLSVGTTRSPAGGRLVQFPMEIGFSKAVRGGRC